MFKSKYDTSSSKHGLYKHPLFSIWMGMRARCYNKNLKVYKYYGGRGVVVCDEWKSDFKQFYDWALANGWVKGLELDKDIKGDGMMYSPENCCFVTDKENSNNRISTVFVEYNGKTMPFQYACELAKVKPKTFHFRMKKLGLTFTEALAFKRKNTGKLPKLSIAQVLEMMDLKKSGVSYYKISVMYKVSKSTAINAIKGKINFHKKLI